MRIFFLDLESGTSEKGMGMAALARAARRALGGGRAALGRGARAPAGVVQATLGPLAGEDAESEAAVAPPPLYHAPPRTPLATSESGGGLTARLVEDWATSSWTSERRRCN